MLAPLGAHVNNEIGLICPLPKSFLRKPTGTRASCNRRIAKHRSHRAWCHSSDQGSWRCRHRATSRDGGDGRGNCALHDPLVCTRTQCHDTKVAGPAHTHDYSFSNNSQITPWTGLPGCPHANHRDLVPSIRPVIPCATPLFPVTDDHFTMIFQCCARVARTRLIGCSSSTTVKGSGAPNAT